MSASKLKIALIAGEDSGDLLGAELLTELQSLNPNIEFFGVGGAKMQAAGMRLIESNQAFAIMGFAEVFKSLPKLLRLRKQIVKNIIAEKPDLFIGIDAPDLNFPIEKKLKKQGVPIIHYVSPSIWAWREKRAVAISDLTDLVMALFPFEPKYYHQHDGAAEFVGHPLARSIELSVNKTVAKKKLNLDSEQLAFALLPGSRWNELKKHTKTFLQTAQAIQQQHQNQKIQWISANTSEEKRAFIVSQAEELGLNLQMFENATDVLKAADATLLASGTVALEAMLCKTPMVVSYQISALTYWIVKTFKMLKLPYYSLPNVLHGGFLVEEILQKDMTVKNLTQACEKLLVEEHSSKLSARFTELHKNLLSEKHSAAECVNDFLQRKLGQIK